MVHSLRRHPQGAKGEVGDSYCTPVSSCFSSLGTIQSRCPSFSPHPSLGPSGSVTRGRVSKRGPALCVKRKTQGPAGLNCTILFVFCSYRVRKGPCVFRVI